MKFCTHCGIEQQNNQKLCMTCGKKVMKQPKHETPLKQNVEGNNNDEETPTFKKNQQKKNMKMRTKITIGLIISLTVILFGAHQWLLSHFDAMKDLQTMDQAITSNDSTAFLKHIELDENALLNEESYFAYIRDHEWNYVKEQYIDIVQSKEMNQSHLDIVIKGQEQDKLFLLKREAILFGLYTTFTWQAIPTNLSITSIEDMDITVKIDTLEQSIKSNSTIDISAIYPGTYDVFAEAENIFGTFEYDKELNLQARNINELDIDFNLKKYPIITNKWDATLFINGENTEKKLDELEYIGPIPENYNIRMHAEWETNDGKVIKSEEVTNEDFDIYGLSFEFDEKNR